jgi:hypothetical protein
MERRKPLRFFSRAGNFLTPCRRCAEVHRFRTPLRHSRTPRRVLARGQEPGTGELVPRAGRPTYGVLQLPWAAFRTLRASLSCPACSFHLFPGSPGRGLERTPFLLLWGQGCSRSEGISRLPNSVTSRALAKPRGFTAPWRKGAPAESPILFVKFASGDGLKALLDLARERAQVARSNLPHARTSTW